MHNQLLKYGMGTTDYKAVLQGSIWGYSESEAVHESTVSCCCKKGICQTGTYKQGCHVLDMWNNPAWCWEDFKCNTAFSFWRCTLKHMSPSHRTMKIVPGPENMTYKGMAEEIRVVWWVDVLSLQIYPKLLQRGRKQTVLHFLWEHHKKKQTGFQKHLIVGNFSVV